MPIYDYECPSCGPFAEFRPMSDYAKPAGCEICGALAPRVVRHAPALATMNADVRAGMAVNERSRHEPRRSQGAHPSGCGCCSTRSKPAMAAGAAKSFPGSRPWMISH